MKTWDRLEKIIGQENLEKIKKTSVLVVGLGGVGGYAIEALARSGIGKLILIDFDEVDETNKNRQLIALTSTIGHKKVDLFAERIHDINPDCQVIMLDRYLKAGDSKDILEKYHPNYLLDACDTIAVKKDLIEHCLQKKIPFLTSMGTGNRLDPSKVEITELSKTEGDPLARILRKWVKEERIKGKIQVVYSRELPTKTTDRTPGSSAFVPSVAGITMASWVIQNIISEK